MIDREPNRRTNDSLQSGEGELALPDPTVPRERGVETSRRRP
jgi:hypothetical protein